MTFLRWLWSFVRSVALYLATVAGGLTLFLILAPLFGYLPYSDRPGPGWHGTFPAMGWNEFWRNAYGMLAFGAFIAILIALGGAIIVALMRTAEHFRLPLLGVRISGAIVSGLITAYFVLGAGWYISLGIAGWIVAIVLGVVAGGWLLPDRPRPPGSGPDLVVESSN